MTTKPEGNWTLPVVREDHIVGATSYPTFHNFKNQRFGHMKEEKLFIHDARGRPMFWIRDFEGEDSFHFFKGRFFIDASKEEDVKSTRFESRFAIGPAEGYVLLDTEETFDENFEPFYCSPHGIIRADSELGRKGVSLITNYYQDFVEESAGTYSFSIWKVPDDSNKD